MKNVWKAARPVLPSELICGEDLSDTVERVLQDESDVYGYDFNDGTLCGAEGKVLEFSGCYFHKCVFSELDFGRISFVDCIFDHCELSNLRLTNAAFQRVEMSHCRMTGLELLRSILMNVSLKESMMDYLSLSEASLDRVVIHDCHMRESIWADVKLLKAAFEQADLSRTQWVRTPLKGMDVSSCTISGWNISLADLRGVKVNASQVIELSGLLGIEIV